MTGCNRWLLALCVLLVSVSAARAQVVLGDQPKVLVPAAPTKQEADGRASLHQYVLGLLCEREDRLIEALHAFELAAKLDPKAPATFKAQVPLLIALDRGEDALNAVTRVVTLDPADYEMWYIKSRLHKLTGKVIEARKALEQGLATEVAKERPEIAQQMYYDLGTLFEAEGSVKQAAEAFANSAKILDHPDHIIESGPFTRDMVLNRAAEVHERIGNLYRKAKQYDLAIEAFKNAQARFPAAAGRLNFNLAQLYLDKQDPAQAVVALDAYLRFRPQGLEAYELKIGLLQRLQRSAEIVPWLEQASAGDPHNVHLKLLLAQQLTQAKRSAQAEKLFLELTEKSPEPNVYKSLFELYRQDAKLGMRRVLKITNQTLERASNKEIQSDLPATQARSLVAALRSNSDISKALLTEALEEIDLRDQGLKFETVHFLAALADRHRRHEDAERFYRACLRDIRPANEALVYSGLLRVLWKEHKYDEILKICQDGLRNARSTNQVLFRNDMARALARLERYKEALREVDKAVELAGDNDRLAVKHLRIRILSQSEQYDRAEQECLALLKEHVLPGETMEIRYLLSGVYTAAKQLAKAEEQLDWILRFDPSNATASNDLGYLWADQGKKLPEAEELIRKAIDQERRQRKASVGITPEEDHDNAAYIDSLGWVLFRRGQVEDARKELERAVTLENGDDATIWDHLGDVYARLNRPAEAKSAWEKAVQLMQREHRRPQDARYLDIQRKLKVVAPQAGAR